jgi:hypothetical protein
MVWLGGWLTGPPWSFGRRLCDPPGCGAASHNHVRPRLRCISPSSPSPDALIPEATRAPHRAGLRVPVRRHLDGHHSVSYGPAASGATARAGNPLRWVKPCGPGAARCGRPLAQRLIGPASPVIASGPTKSGCARRHRRQPRQSVVSARPARRHPGLVPDEPPAATLQDRRALIRHAPSFVLQLAESYLTGRLFRQTLGRIEPLAWHPT